MEAEAIPRLLFLLVLLYTFYNLFLSQYNIFRVLELRKASKELDAQLSVQKQKNAKDEELLRLVKENPEHFKEKFARHYMQLQGREEVILLFDQ